MKGVAPGAAPGVEDGEGTLRSRRASGQHRLENGVGYRALADVPPLGLLGLEHPAVLGRLHRRVASDVK